ncbi:MAG TPA: hypothetical protein VNR87_11595 [Flavisolibacter sp.]|nr:hypothetical protein [Flavisolibacter sp.]
MAENEHIIDIEASRRPYNAYLVLPLALLQKIAPLLKDEIMKGLVDSDDRDRVVLHLLLDTGKISRLKKLTASWTTASVAKK